MIFVTVGTQLPFERLIKAVDLWAENNPEIKVVAQIGQTVYRPKFMDTLESVDPDEYERYLLQSRLVVGHVGMGTIISGIKHGKPLVLMPRVANLGEHRNDHQLASAKQFGTLGGVHIVHDQTELNSAINQVLSPDVPDDMCNELNVSAGLIKRISDFVKETQNEHRHD